LVGYESFGWPNAKKCLRRVENLHPDIPNPKLRKYVDAKLEGKISEPVRILPADHKLKIIVTLVHCISRMAHRGYRMWETYSLLPSRQGWEQIET
jgi:hypothetical protein